MATVSLNVLAKGNDTMGRGAFFLYLLHISHVWLISSIALINPVSVFPESLTNLISLVDSG